MNAIATGDAAVQPADRWTARRIFVTALVVTLGIVTALVMTFTVLVLLFGPVGGQVVAEQGEVVDVVQQGTGQATDAELD